MAFPRELETERLRLRQWREEDVEALWRVYQDPGYLEHMRPVDLDGTREQVERFVAEWDLDGFGLWAAEDWGTGEFMGRIGVLRHRDWPLEEGPVEVGWVLGPRWRGKGLATEGGRASVTAAFEHLDIDRVLSITTPANVKSRAVMERLGFTCRGDTHWHGRDVVWYAIDRADWRN